MSFEKDAMERNAKGEQPAERLEISLLKYLWDASPLSFLSGESHHEFFKKISILSSFTDNEVRIFTKFLHRREFSPNEVIFRQGDSGYGLYFIYRGSVGMFANYSSQSEDQGDLIIRLDRYQYFGEMGLLEEFNRRSATAVAAESTVLLGIFKPDLERLLETYPVIGAKFLRETALIMANRMGQITREMVALKKRIIELEQQIS
jgi:CRP/FNR family transcriptional regulator, cyclic AMP receptor protein